MDDSKLFLSQLSGQQLQDIIRNVIRDELLKRDAEKDEAIYLTRREVGKMLSPPVCDQTLINWTRAGKLKTYSNGGGRRILYKKSEVLQSMKELKRYRHA